MPGSIVKYQPGTLNPSLQSLFPERLEIKVQINFTQQASRIFQCLMYDGEPPPRKSERLDSYQKFLYLIYMSKKASAKVIRDHPRSPYSKEIQRFTVKLNKLARLGKLNYEKDLFWSATPQNLGKTDSSRLDSILYRKP